LGKDQKKKRNKDKKNLETWEISYSKLKKPKIVNLKNKKVLRQVKKL